MFLKYIMSNKIKHFFEYLDYENLNAEDNSFQRPEKNNKGIFLAMLTTPYKFYLPKSELCDMFQDSYGNNMINYIINLDSHAEIVRFLENFDSLCIANAANNSESWFGKDLNTEKLIKYYNTLYELSEDEKSLYLPISVENSDIEDIINYNEDDTSILSVKIVGIEFFQQTFRWQIKFNSIVDSIEESDDEDEVNFDVLVGGNIPVQEIEKHFTSLEIPRSSENEENIHNNSHEDVIDLKNEIKKGSDEYESDVSDGQYRHSGEDNCSYDELEYNKEDTSDEEQSSQEDDSSINEESSDDESDTNQYKEVSKEVESKSDYKASRQYNDSSESDNDVEVESKAESEVESEVESDVESQENIERVSNNSNSDRDNDKQEVEEIENIDKELPNETKENITLNKSIINDLAEDVPEDKTSNNILHNDTIQEIESIISEKRLTEKKYLINANRAQRALDTLSTKASEVTKEIELYENKLRECQQTN